MAENKVVALNLGPVTSYGLAKSKGFPGTEEAWVQKLMDSALEEDVDALDEKIDDLDTKVDTQVETINATIEQEVGAVDTKADGIDANLTTLSGVVAQKMDTTVAQASFVPVPSASGAQGDALRNNGDGTTAWAPIGLPTDEQTGTAINAWLTAHPEATTTVQDGAITRAKLITDLQEKTDLAQNATAPAFDATVAYTPGAHVTYGGKLYVLPSGHEANATWADTTKTEVNLGGEVSDLKSAASESCESIYSLARNEEKIKIPFIWEVGGISSGNGAETDNTSYRRTGFISVPEGMTVYVTFPSTIRMYRNVYNTDKSYRAATQMDESASFSFTGDRLVRFSLMATSGNTLPDDINAVVNVKLDNKIIENITTLIAKNTAQDAFAATIGNGVLGTNTALRAAVKSIKLYGFDNTIPCYFGLLRKNYQSSGKTVFNIFQNGVYEVVTLSETTGTVHYHIDKDSSGISGDLLSGIKSIDITIDLDRLDDPTDYSLNAITGLINPDNIFAFEYPDIGADTAMETYPYLGLLAEETIADTTITDLSDLTGKTCYLIGDSMTAGGTLDTYLNTKLGLVCTNYGYGGCTIAKNDATVTGKSMVERILGTGTSDNVEGSADIWVIWGGYNDASYRDTPLGDIYSNDISTLYGALKTICKTIQEKTNNPRILLVTMHQSSNRMITAPNHDGKGEFIRDMREAFYQVGEMYGIAVCDLYKYGGISPVNNLQMTSDGVHLNAKGKQFIYPKIANAIKNMV